MILRVMLALAFLLIATPALADFHYDYTNQVGYGINNGGQGGIRCQITTNADAGDGSLRACAGMPARREIDCASGLKPIELVSAVPFRGNATFDGTDCPEIRNKGQIGNAMVKISGQSEIILSNIRWRYVAWDTHCARSLETIPKDVLGCGALMLVSNAGPGQPLETGSSEIYIVHNTFLDCSDKCVVIWNGATNITLDSNRFQRAYMASAAGIGPEYTISPWPMLVTWYRNFFDDVYRRSPRCTGGYHCDITNNVVRNWGEQKGDFGVSVAGEAHAWLDSNIFYPPPKYTSDNPAISVTAYGPKDDPDRGPGYYTLGPWSVIRDGKLSTANELILDPVADPSDWTPRGDYSLPVAPPDRALYGLVTKQAGKQ